MMNISGKHVTVVILAVAFAAAGTSWWFRYGATHRTAEFWGPAAVRLIRDAPVVELYRLNGATNSAMPVFDEKIINSASATDISHARGITHLRNALLKDHSYRWPARVEPPDVPWQWAIFFLDGDEGLILLFSPDWRFVRMAPDGDALSSEPIADGLAIMLQDLSTAAER